jgi:NAD(P)-dependent dehydrogenase (short-subunit alcohol dehydrogenase family)
MNKFVTFHDLKDKSVYITGGGSGIGAALTEGFIEQGAKVAFVQRSDASAFCDEMEEKHGSRPHFIKCDLADVDALKASVEEARGHNGPINVLVNNAANDARHSLMDYDASDFDQSIAVNLRPHFFTTQAVVPDMKSAGYGAIVNYSSVSYLMGQGIYPSYVTAKAGIVALTRSIAREFGPFGIRANALLPGWVLTEKQLDKWATEEGLKAHLETQCLKEHLAPRDVVDATLFLSSEASRMMTAQAMVVDGGVTFTG